MDEFATLAYLAALRMHHRQYRGFRAGVDIRLPDVDSLSDEMLRLTAVRWWRQTHLNERVWQEMVGP
jgi:hypothetical protein